MHFKQSLEALDFELTGMSPPKALTFVVPKGSMHASKGGKKPTVLINVDAYKFEQYAMCVYFSSNFPHCFLQ